MITEAVVSSVFDKQLSKMHVVRGGKEEERASGKRSALLWSSSYGPSHSWASESEALPPPPPSTSTSTISTTSTLEHGKLSRFAQSCMKRFLSMGEDLDDDTRWWQEHGTKTVLVTLAPLTSLSLILLLFDFGSPNDQDMLSHIGWLAVYDFFIPLSYSYERAERSERQATRGVGAKLGWLTVYDFSIPLSKANPPPRRSL